MAVQAGQYRQGIKDQVAAHHYAAMECGFQAIECQRPREDADWLANFNKTSYSSQHHYRDWLAGIELDRASLVESYRLWENSIDQASRRDYYRRRGQAPWQFWMTVPAPEKLPPLPELDSDLKSWWFDNIEPFVKAEELNNEFFTTCDRPETMEFNCEVFNHISTTGGKAAVQKWLALRDIVGPTQELIDG